MKVKEIIPEVYNVINESIKDHYLSSMVIQYINELNPDESLENLMENLKDERWRLQQELNKKLDQTGFDYNLTCIQDLTKKLSIIMTMIKLLEYFNLKYLLDTKFKNKSLDDCLKNIADEYYESYDIAKIAQYNNLLTEYVFQHKNCMENLQNTYKEIYDLYHW